MRNVHSGQLPPLKETSITKTLWPGIFLLHICMRVRLSYIDAHIDVCLHTCM